MSLLVKRLGPVFLLALLLSCEDPNEIGLNLNPDLQNLNIHYIELPLDVANIQIDSLNTSRNERLLMGKTFNPAFGTVTTTSFTELKPRSFSINIPEEADFDSLVLKLSGTYIYGDGHDLPQTVNIHRLSMPLIDTVSSSAYYNYYSFSTADYQSETVGVFNFTVPEERPDTLTITSRLDDLLGSALFDEAKDENSTTFDNAKLFDDYFNGLAFVPDPGNSMVFGANTQDLNTVMTLYYSTPDDTVSRFTSFIMYSFLSNSFAFNTHFSNIDIDHSGTSLETITDPHTEFEPIDDKIFIQAGAGLFPKIKLDGLRAFIDDNQILTNHVELVIENIEPFNQGFEPSTFVTYYITTEKNQFVTGTSSSGTGPRAIQSPNSPQPFSVGNELFVPFLSEEEIPYSGNITPYVQLGIVDQRLTQMEDFLIVPTGSASTINQFSIDKSNIKLRIFYTPVNSN